MISPSKIASCTSTSVIARLIIYLSYGMICKKQAVLTNSFLNGVNIYFFWHNPSKSFPLRNQQFHPHPN
jgi:hypothetical protein